MYTIVLHGHLAESRTAVCVQGRPFIGDTDGE